MSDDVQTPWENFLNPTTLRENLIIASVYTLAFELLKAAITDRIRSFYSFAGFEPDHPKYKSEVLSKNSSPVYASLKWLQESHAITEDDVSIYKRAKELRNRLAHGLSGMLHQGLPSDLTVRFREMVSLLEKIERWWIVNVDIDHALTTEEEASIIPGPIVALQLLLAIGLGPEKESKKFLEELIKLTRPTAESRKVQ